MTDTLDKINISSNKIQFGRVIELEIYNYNLGKKVIIPNSLHISFDFFKTIDEVKNASTGRVTVYNLSDKTFDLVRTQHACQMILKAGYEGSVGIVFFADIIGCKKIVKEGNVEIQFTVSANFFEYKLNYGLQIEYNNNYTIATLLGVLCNNLNERESIATGKKINHSIYFSTPDSYSETDTQKFNEYISTAKIGKNFAYSGSLESALREICNEFGFSPTTRLNQNQTDYVLTIKDNYSNYYLDRIYSNYPTINDQDTVDLPSPVFDASDTTKAILLTFENGLLGTPHVDYKVFSVPENYKGLVTDETQLKSQIAENERIAKQQQKEEKAKSSGKPVKPRKIGTKRIKKTYLSAVAQLNPDIKPQTAIRIESIEEEYNGLYRVRNCTYKGDNFKGEFTVSMFLEDANGVNDLTGSSRDFSDITPDNTVEATGELGSDYNNQESNSSDADSDSSENSSTEAVVEDI